MVLDLVVLGVVLSLDNFRTAIILGPLEFPWRRALQIAVVFGFFDGVAPLTGMLLGHDTGQQIGGALAGLVGACALGLYGGYLTVRALSAPTRLEAERLWSIFGLPVPLSLDNVLAGAGLGLLGVSPLGPAALFGAITIVMTFAGLQLGRMVSRFVPVRPRWDLVVGVALIAEAFVFGIFVPSGD
jgi:manganese efflux pump family protein